MTSETYVVGGPIPEKVAIGARVRRYAEGLGLGHVLASVENRTGHIRVEIAQAFPLTAADYCIQRDLEAHLNEPPFCKEAVR